VAAFAVLLLVAREISFAFHIPWLEPRAMLDKLLHWRR
jgi:hypothetical protein